MDTQISFFEIQLATKLNSLGYHSFTSQEIRECIASSEIIKYKKNDFVESPVLGEYICLVIEGVFRYYNHNENSKKVILRFSTNQDILFTSGVCDEQTFVQAVNQCTVLKIKTRDLFDKLEDRNYFLIELEKKALFKIEEELYYSKLAPKHHYIQFVKRFKSNSYSIPNIDLANYLNISPQMMCKIKKQLLNYECLFIALFGFCNSAIEQFGELPIG